jgi:hypothetical protein
MYTRAEMVYKIADSAMISAAKRSFFEPPGLRLDARRIRATMMMVLTVVVPTDKA